MDFKEYQEAASKTAIYPPIFNVLYPALGLAGEGGELANKIKKLLRDKFSAKLQEGDVDLIRAAKVVAAALEEIYSDPEVKQDIAKEIGDNLWYNSAIARDFGLNLDDIATQNIDKLASRKARGVIGGSGDNR